MGDHRNLQVWQRAQLLATRLDFESRKFTRGNAALSDQLRRASLSIPTNLAEGACRGRDGEFNRFLSIAIGSAAETDSLLLHAHSVGAMDSGTYSEVAADLTVIRKMLFKLRRALGTSASASQPEANLSGSAQETSSTNDHEKSQEPSVRGP